jgi:hypothetical protein
MQKIINGTTTTVANPIHNGLNTHSHDHEIKPVNLRAINSIVKRPTNPIPPLDELELFDIVSSLKYVFKKSLNQALHRIGYASR